MGCSRITDPTVFTLPWAGIASQWRQRCAVIPTSTTVIAACSFPLHLRQSLGTILSPTSQCLHPSCLKLGFCLCVFLKARLLTAPDVYRPARLRRWLLPSGDSSLPRAGKHPPEPPRCSLLHLPLLCRTSCSMLTVSFPSPGTANSQICSTRKIKLNLIAN